VRLPQIRLDGLLRCLFPPVPGRLVILAAALCCGLLVSRVEAAPKVKWTATLQKLVDPQMVVGVRTAAGRVFLVEHRSGKNPRLLVFSDAGKVLFDREIPAALVSAFAPTADGKKVFAVAGYGATALLIDVETGKSVTAYTRDREDGFRFTPPIGVRAVDGGIWTRGFFLVRGSNLGDFLVAMTPSENTEIERKLDITALARRAKVPGQLLSLAPAGDVVAFTMAPRVDDNTLFLASPGGADVPRKIDQSGKFSGLGITPDGKTLFYGVDRGATGELVAVDTASGKRRVLGTGRFSLPLVSDDGSRLLVGKVSGPTRQQLFTATAATGWKLTPLAIPGWVDAIALYQVSADGRTAVLWSKDGITVVSLQ